jgi:NADP-dependent 3-hydroxy acid dehydrogenase YdfG
MKPIAVVTGASSGIGAATAKLLAKNGYQVVAVARRTERLHELTHASEDIEVLTIDVTSDSDVAKLAEHLAGKAVEVLVCNAGGAFDHDSVITSDPKIWMKTYDVNVVGSVRCIKSLVPVMSAHGKGHVVLITSTAGQVAYENGGSYVAAKHGEVALARTLRLELGGLPIRVTEIAPGMVKTDEFALTRFSGDKEKAARIYAGVLKPLTDGDVAEAIRWSVMLPEHFNIDSMTIRPVAQAAQHKVHRVSSE